MIMSLMLCPSQMYRDDHPCAEDRAAITVSTFRQHVDTTKSPQEGGVIGGTNNDQYWDARQRGHNADRLVITVSIAQSTAYYLLIISIGVRQSVAATAKAIRQVR